MKAEDNKKDYHSTTPEPFKPSKADKTTWEDPDKTKKKEKNDPTRENDPDITSQPKNKKPGIKKSDDESDDDDENIQGSILNRTEV